MEALHDWINSESGSVIALWTIITVFAVIGAFFLLTGLFPRRWDTLKRSFRRYVRQIISDLEDR